MNVQPNTTNERSPLTLIQIDWNRLQKRKQKLYPQMTDSEFAELIGVTPATYSDYKSTKKAALPSLKVALVASFALRLDLRNLVSNAEEIKHFFAENIR